MPANCAELSDSLFDVNVELDRSLESLEDECSDSDELDAEPEPELELEFEFGLDDDDADAEPDASHLRLNNSSSSVKLISPFLSVSAFVKRMAASLSEIVPSPSVSNRLKSGAAENISFLNSVLLSLPL